jgi:acetyl/propionyl-CoA carboxylase alpha subunit
LRRALAELRVHGVHNNRSFLIEVLQHPEFLAGNLDTHFLQRHADLHRPPARTEADALHSLAVALWQQEQRRAAATVLAAIPSGWRNNPSQPQWVEMRAGETPLRVEYQVQRSGHIEASVNQTSYRAVVVSCSADHIELQIDDVRRTFRLFAHAGVHYVQSVLGSSELQELPRFPARAPEQVHGGCVAPMPGRILAVHVTAGQAVKKGDVLVILEAMKMEHQVCAPHDGEVAEVRIETGQQVDAGTLLIVLAGGDAA